MKTADLAQAKRYKISIVAPSSSGYRCRACLKKAIDTAQSSHPQEYPVAVHQELVSEKDGLNSRAVSSHLKAMLVTDLDDRPLKRQKISMDEQSTQSRSVVGAGHNSQRPSLISVKGGVPPPHTLVTTDNPASLREPPKDDMLSSIEQHDMISESVTKHGTQIPLGTQGKAPTTATNRLSQLIPAMHSHFLKSLATRVHAEAQHVTECERQTTHTTKQPSQHEDPVSIPMPVLQDRSPILDAEEIDYAVQRALDMMQHGISHDSAGEPPRRLLTSTRTNESALCDDPPIDHNIPALGSTLNLDGCANGQIVDDSSSIQVTRRVAQAAISSSKHVQRIHSPVETNNQYYDHSQSGQRPSSTGPPVRQNQEPHSARKSIHTAHESENQTAAPYVTTIERDARLQTPSTPKLHSSVENHAKVAGRGTLLQSQDVHAATMRPPSQSLRQEHRTVKLRKQKAVQVKCYKCGHMFVTHSQTVQCRGCRSQHQIEAVGRSSNSQSILSSAPATSSGAPRSHTAEGLFSKICTKSAIQHDESSASPPLRDRKMARPCVEGLGNLKSHSAEALTTLIGMALIAAPNHRSTTRAISEWIMRNIPSYRHSGRNKRLESHLANRMSVYRSGGPASEDKWYWTKTKRQDGDTGHDDCSWWQINQNASFKWVKWDAESQRPSTERYQFDQGVADSIIVISSDDDDDDRMDLTSPHAAKQANAETSMLNGAIANHLRESSTKNTPDATQRVDTEPLSTSASEDVVMVDSGGLEDTKPGNSKPLQVVDSTNLQAQSDIEMEDLSSLCRTQHVLKSSSNLQSQVMASQTVTHVKDATTAIIHGIACDSREDGLHVSIRPLSSDVDRPSPAADEPTDDRRDPHVIQHSGDVGQAPPLSKIKQNGDSTRVISPSQPGTVVMDQPAADTMLAALQVMPRQKHARPLRCNTDLVEALLQRDIIGRKKSSLNLFDLVPAKNDFDQAAKLSNIRSRKSRKAMFGKEPLRSRLGDPVFFVRRTRRDKATVLDSSKDTPSKRHTYNFDPLADGFDSASQELPKICATVQEFFDLPARPIPIIDANKQLAMRDGTRAADGSLPRAKLVYPTGYGS